MFRRLASGLPKEPVFPPDLKSLGYFINENDEIRNIENPKAYFKFFLTKNERYNALQREGMNEAVRQIVHDRLQKLGLNKIRLPLGATDTEPNVPIYVSPDLKSKERVIILFYENTQDLGCLAHRVIGGKGGINQGSAVDLVKYIQSFPTSPSNPDSPGIILANMGQLRWWRRGKKAVTQSSWYALPQKSLVSPPYRMDPLKNTIPGNRSPGEHVNYIFNHVVEGLCGPSATLDVITVSDAAAYVFDFLQESESWKKWSSRMSCLASVGSYYEAHFLTNKAFTEWFRIRGRTYTCSSEPIGDFLAGPEGFGREIPAYGSPCFSLGVPYYSELLIPKGYKIIIDWIQEVAADPDYVNPIYPKRELPAEEEDFDDEAAAEYWKPREIEEVGAAITNAVGNTREPTEGLKLYQTERELDYALSKKVPEEQEASDGKEVAEEKNVSEEKEIAE